MSFRISVDHRFPGGRTAEETIPIVQELERAVGAGPAGLEAARVAGMRGRRVELHDKGDHVGGVLYPAATPDFKRELRTMIDWWEGELARVDNVAVHLSHEITADSPELAAADEIIVATGSTPLIPPIPGIAKPQVMEVLEAHSGRRPGTGWSSAEAGCPARISPLSWPDGHEVTLIEMVDEIAIPTAGRGAGHPAAATSASRASA